MGIAGFVMEDPVGNLSAGQHLGFYELAGERDVLIDSQLRRQGNDELLGELRVGAFLESLDRVPEGFGGTCDRAICDEVARPLRRIRRQQELLMPQTPLAGIVDRAALGLVLHLRAMPVRCRQHRAAAGAARDELGREMRDGQSGAGSRTRTKQA